MSRYFAVLAVSHNVAKFLSLRKIKEFFTEDSFFFSFQHKFRIINRYAMGITFAHHGSSNRTQIFRLATVPTIRRSTCDPRSLRLFEVQREDGGVSGVGSGFSARWTCRICFDASKLWRRNAPERKSVKSRKKRSEIAKKGNIKIRCIGYHL